MNIKQISGQMLVFTLLGGAFAASQPRFAVTSPAFAQGATIPARFTCTGLGSSPQLAFKNPPKGTKSLAILGWDDDAPGGLASIWVAYDLAPDTVGLPEGVPLGASVLGFKQGRNTSGKLGFSAPCPARGDRAHHYYWDIYALNVSSLGLPAGASLNAVHSAIKKHKLLEVKLMGVYAR